MPPSDGNFFIYDWAHGGEKGGTATTTQNNKNKKAAEAAFYEKTGWD